MLELNILSYCSVSRQHLAIYKLKRCEDAKGSLLDELRSLAFDSR